MDSRSGSPKRNKVGVTGPVLWYRKGALGTPGRDREGVGTTSTKGVCLWDYLSNYPCSPPYFCCPTIKYVTRVRSFRSCALVPRIPSPLQRTRVYKGLGFYSPTESHDYRVGFWFWTGYSFHRRTPKVVTRVTQKLLLLISTEMVNNS